MVALVNQNCLSSLTSFYSRNILTILAYVFPFAESLRVYRPRYRSNLSFAVKVAEARPGKHRWQGFSARKLWNAIQKVAVRWFAIGKRSDSRQEWEYRVREIRAGASNFTRPVYIAGQKFQLLGRCLAAITRGKEDEWIQYLARIEQLLSFLANLLSIFYNYR